MKKNGIARLKAYMAENAAEKGTWKKAQHCDGCLPEKKIKRNQIKENIMQNTISAIIQEIEIHTKEPLLIAIDGRCAAGKTTLASKLEEKLNCNIIHMDHFFLQPQQRTEDRLREPGGNIDYERFLSEVIFGFNNGGTFSYRRFDCKCMGFVEEIHVEPGAVTIVEGAYSCHPALWEYYDFRIFLDVDGAEQLRRIERRNGTEALPMFRDRWIPLEERYFETYRIKERCDHVFTLAQCHVHG